MQIAKILMGVILAGALGILVASWRSDFSEAPGQQKFSAAQTPARSTPEITFDLLAQAVFTNEKTPPTYPVALRERDGQRVRMAGFVTPYNDPERMQKLLLVRSPGGCYFCNPPEVNAVVFVRRVPKDPPLPTDGQPVTFEGVLRLWRCGLPEADETRQFLLTIDDAATISAH